MLYISKRLALGICLILLASGILLATDQERRSGGGGAQVWRLALLQQASTSVLDEGVAGTIDGLAAAGFRDGANVQITHYNAHGDMGTANTIAREIVNGPFDLVITISTPSLQCVAGANQQPRMKHVFGLVGDPFGAGVGLDRADPMKHPPYMVGQGIFLPVDESFRLAQQMYPALRTIGVVWNPSEPNSRSFTFKAREVCKASNLELLETTADNSAAVLEAAQSLIGRGAQAIWVGGDVTVSIAMKSLIVTARKAGIPVFSITPGEPDRGTLFDVGINFYECGKLTGALVADILKGADPATIPIRDVMDLVPRRLVVNKLVLKDLKDGWQLPAAVLGQADIIVDEKGINERRAK